MPQLNLLGEKLHAGSHFLATATAAQKSQALRAISEALIAHKDEIIAANELDIEQARASGMSDAFIDRLMLNSERISAISVAVLNVATLPDPIGQVLEENVLPNGLLIRKVRVPMGVIGIIYEARPNVTVDAAVLCLKAGSAVLLRGGKETISSNITLEGIMRDALASCGFPPDCISLMHDTSRQMAIEMMRRRSLIDVIIPRGGAGLIKAVVENANVPVIETGTGNCHIYVDRSAKLQMAVDIITNAKAQRVSVCNAAETLLVHSAVAAEFLPLAYKSLKNAGVELRGCKRTRDILSGVTEASELDFATEFLDYILAVRIVDTLDQAIEHIRSFTTGHSECIITENKAAAEIFLNSIDSAAVYVNASTRFTDGEEFGMGAEIGISTQKVHARGPMGLNEICSYKYHIIGSGQIR